MRAKRKNRATRKGKSGARIVAKLQAFVEKKRALGIPMPKIEAKVLRILEKISVRRAKRRGDSKAEAMRQAKAMASRVLHKATPKEANFSGEEAKSFVMKHKWLILGGLGLAYAWKTGLLKKVL